MAIVGCRGRDRDRDREECCVARNNASLHILSRMARRTFRVTDSLERVLIAIFTDLPKVRKTHISDFVCASEMITKVLFLQTQ